MIRQLVALCSALAIAGCLQQAKAAAPPAAPVSQVAQVDDARLNNAAAEPQNWLAHGGDQQAHRFSGLDQITPDNIAGLKPAWSWTSTPRAARNPRQWSSMASST